MSTVAEFNLKSINKIYMDAVVYCELRYFRVYKFLADL